MSKLRVAGFLDCENIQATYSDQIFTLLNGMGNLVSCNGYADFSAVMYRGWQDPFARIGCRAIQVYHNTKDGADCEILLDVAECAIKERKIDAVCIVSNDGIYNVAKRILHKYDKQFFVIGTNVANRLLEDSADKFYRLEGADPRSVSPEQLINDTIKSNGGIMRLSDLGNAVWGMLPNYKVLGFRNMRSYIENLGFHIAADTGFDPPIDWVQSLTK